MRAMIAVLVLTFAAAPAHADRAKAEAFFDAGGRAFREQSFAAAAAQFELAYAELPLPEIAFSAAQAYRKQYYVDPKPEYVKRAVELYRIYLDKVKTGGRVADASDGLAEMARELERLTANGAKIAEVQRDQTRIAVSVSVIGEQRAQMTELAVLPATESTHAKATLDGSPMPLFDPIEVAPGDHTVAVTADGYEPVSETRRVVDGVTELVSIELQPLPAHLAIDIEDGAHVAIDGRAIGTAPLSAQELAAGKYLVVATRRGREPAQAEITLARGETRTLPLPMRRTGRRRAVPWLLVGAGAVAVGATVSALAADHYDHTMASLDAERTTTGITSAQLAQYRAATRDRDDLRTAAFGLGGAALVTAAIAAGLYYLDEPTPGDREPTRAITPVITPGGAGVALVVQY